MSVTINGTNGLVFADNSTQASAQVGMKNRIIDGGFIINQRGYVSNTALSSGVYAHDRWKAGSGGCTYTFTQAAQGVNTTITITAGTLVQVIEGCNLPEGGTYVLSWTGTAQGRLNGGSYGASGITITGWTAGTNLNVEFNTGTLGNVQLEKGSTATSFDYRPYGTELALCQRYYSKSYNQSAVPGSNAGYANSCWSSFTPSTTGYAGSSKFCYPVTMRTTPSISVWTYNGTANQWHVGQNGVSESAYVATAGNISESGFSVASTGVSTTSSYNIMYGSWAASAEL